MCRLFVFMLAPVVALRSVRSASQLMVQFPGFRLSTHTYTDDGQAEFAFIQFEREGDSGREPTTSTYDRKKS